MYGMGENICKSYIFDKRLQSKIYKDLMQFNSKLNDTVKKWAKDLTDIYPNKTYTWLTVIWKGAENH